MFLALLRSELFKVSHRAMPRILLLILAGIVALIYLFFVIALRTGTEGGTSQQTLDEIEDGARVAATRESGLGIVQSVGTVMAVILGVSVISNEYSWGTIRLILPRVGSRSALLSSKLAVALLFAALVAVVGFLVALASSFVVSVIEDFSTSLGSNFLPETVAAILRTIYVMLPYVALGFFVAVLTRSTAAGIAIALSVLFLEGLVSGGLGLLPEPLDRSADALLTPNVSAVMRANQLDGDGTGINPWQGAAVLAAYIALFVGLAYWIFLRRDVTSSAGS